MFEVRINPRRAGSELYTIACTSDDNGFKVVSVIIVGKEEVALVDAQWSLSYGYRVLAEIIELNKPLKTVYVSHAHPDHYFGLQGILAHFPEARVLALPDVARVVNEQLTGKLDEWREEIGIFNVPDREIPFTVMDTDSFEVEGERVEVFGKVWGDLKYNTVVHIPSLSTLIGSDVLFNRAHPFTCEVTAEERELWLAELDRFEAMGCECVIPGHAKHGLPYDNSSIEYTRQYLIATREELARCKTRDEFYYAMDMRFFDSELRRSNEMNSNVFYGQREWDWRDEEED